MKHFPQLTHKGVEQLGSASLIAAAPDLLLSLQQAVARVELANDEGNPILSAWLPEARKAIALALTEVRTARIADRDAIAALAADLAAFWKEAERAKANAKLEETK